MLFVTIETSINCHETDMEIDIDIDVDLGVDANVEISPPEVQGLLPRIVEDLFKTMEEESRSNVVSEVTASLGLVEGFGW